MKNHGFLKVASASPRIRVANVSYNVEKIIELSRIAGDRGAKIIVFPELSITGYTCGDLFFQNHILQASLIGIQKIASSLIDHDLAVIVGFPFLIKDRLFNCSAILLRGDIIGIVPKYFISESGDICEKRWFSSGFDLIDDVKKVAVNGNTVPFGNLKFSDIKNRIHLGLEIGDSSDLAVSSGTALSLNGVNILANLTAASEFTGKANAYRTDLISYSKKLKIGCITSGAGVHESTTDLVFGGHCVIAESGVILSETERFSRDDQIIFADFDIDAIQAARNVNSAFSDSSKKFRELITTEEVTFEFKKIFPIKTIDRFISQHPFLPATQIEQSIKEIFDIQSAGLAKRIEHSDAKNAVIAISGGLDSTLALLVTVKTFDLLKLSRKNIIAITMPGFGTTSLTYKNAHRLMEIFDVTIKEIDIKEACLQHMKDIGHDKELQDVAFENMQARERTQILMDIANKVNGIVIGTGDLSELALGWATYNGDHMSMYGVNSGVPKTLIRQMIVYLAENEDDKQLATVLMDIINTPISPELLPPGKDGTIAQSTESFLGSYELHDFFLYHTMISGITPEKLLHISCIAFDGKFEKRYIKEVLKTFYSRFFSQQFKRSASPDGPKVCVVSLSPRCGWKMPSDADGSMWITALDECDI